MAVNEHRQLEVAAQLSEMARALAHSTRDVPAPADSYDLLGELVATVDRLEQVCRQLSRWHTNTIDGVHHEGEDESGDGVTGTVTAAVDLESAAFALNTASTSLRTAHSANGVVRWFQSAP